MSNIKELIREKIDAFYADYKAKFHQNADSYYLGIIDGLDMAERILDALPDEPVEKQKEQKPAEWSKNDTVFLNEITDFFENKTVRLQHDLDMYAHWLKSLPERFNLQPKQEWSEDWREEDIQTRFAFYTYKDDSSVLYLSNVFVEEASRNHGFGTRILRAAEKVAETIGAITICLKVKQDSPANAWYRKNGYGYVAFEDGYDWLEKNLEYLKPAKSTEWSEEDEDMLNSCISSIEEAKENRYAYKETDGDTSYDHEIAWLKSLRPVSKESLQSWKPTDEHMKVFDTIAFQRGVQEGRRLEREDALTITDIEKFRREATKDILPAIIDKKSSMCSYEEVVKEAIAFADELIKQLKEE